MDRATQALRTLAVLTLVLCIATILYQLPQLLSAAENSFNYISFVNSFFNQFALATCLALGFATGVVAVVIVAQRHHRRWFVGLVVPTAVIPYCPFLVGFASSRILYSALSLLTYLRYLVLSYTILPLVTALVVLAYTVRLHQRSTMPAPTDEADLEIEYSRLD